MSGSLTHSPSQIMQNLVKDLTLAVLPSSAQGTTDWPIWYATLPNDPDNALLVSDTAGIPNGRLMIGGEQQEQHGFTITVRSASYATVFTKARAVKVALDESVNRTSVTISSSVYLIHSVSTRPGPIYAGKEEGTKRELFTINGTVNIEQTT